ncbi:MAG: DNA polymerase III subunit gamma/tau [Methylohalobius sp.]|nr:DNA polymerase III subunit gamma/tau [Methylohalobius sp.]
MSYQALARTWRPRRFAEITGQAHVVQALRNALRTGRTHHAYLFTGTRGVGKTTIARILAKAFNCEQLQDGEPCGQCEVCLAVDEGRFVDLIEVDAASRTRVEDTQKLLENAQYAPSCGRYKVYLIDEVHMLSGHSFNALLKTLEEPPPHVKFLLATTDPQKIPATVLSRCLQFGLKKLAPDQIEARLKHILKFEGIACESGALRRLTRAADGSLRDALSLLDQAIAYGGGQVRTSDVEAMLGLSRRSLTGLVEALAARDVRAVMAEVALLAEAGIELGEVLKEILSLLHRIALAQMLPETAEQDEERDFILAQARALSPEDVQLCYQIALMGQRDLPLAPDPRTGLEMVLLRMLAFRPLEIPEVALKPTSVEVEVKQDIPSEQWADLLARMPLAGMTKELAHHCVLDRLDERRCELVLDQSLAHLYSANRKEQLERALQAGLGRRIELVIRFGKNLLETPAGLRQRQQQERREAAERAIAEDETVRTFVETCNAQIVSIKPIEIDGF